MRIALQGSLQMAASTWVHMELHMVPNSQPCRRGPEGHRGAVIAPPSPLATNLVWCSPMCACMRTFVGDS